MENKTMIVVAAIIGIVMGLLAVTSTLLYIENQQLKGGDTIVLDGYYISASETTPDGYIAWKLGSTDLEGDIVIISSNPSFKVAAYQSYTVVTHTR